MIFVDIALKAVGIQLVYAAIVVAVFTLADHVKKKKDHKDGK